ncbi:TetR/AcrR family transcriptional regulator [Cellulomonas fimi]|uniref:Regulatory protein TetR n=1 Tax=Cellulomonas fimi (strain ATCC 484 / DSM 20113 / JCM 1341 / CCUG 24087 / LMG 16345 / NBRC 15513 / NCIMB 8980 / NCTC 7547 / NRS-133) TaxID=590998 RepID=F4H035_CELFA|nr:TetR/AcrR family transcriptional regulator [Cellulomonas fimi]AEE44957.1 regulatory protein TetR [Cellulomonas fimi ATCC 484]NNH07219.1 TetR/AcrR family transcriptional regulator [Cellulomonas fimi]VEH27799.1 pyrimidine utilization regulatory protein R [Cellulomonas fimi]
MSTDLVGGTRGRTRRAILDAAVRTLARDTGASLAQIADAADVGRTTLHRYFPERGDLLAAVADEAGTRLTEVAARARLHEGPGLDAILRACQECLQLGDLLTLLFTDVVPLDSCEPADGFTTALDGACARGLADGSLDPRLTPGWVQGTVWAALYLAWSELRAATTPPHDVVGQLLLTVGKALAAPQAAPH